MTGIYRIMISLTIVVLLTPYGNLLPSCLGQRLVSAIKCFSCQSSNDPKCGDPFDNSTIPITDCAQEKGLPHLPDVRPTLCRKIRQKDKKSILTHCTAMKFLNIDNVDSRTTMPSLLQLSYCQHYHHSETYGCTMCQVNGEWRYSRDCAVPDELDIQGDERSCSTRTGTDGMPIEYCTCNSKDGCNSSYMATPSTYMFVLVLGVSLLKFIS